MAFTLATVLEAARDRHPAFDKRRAPDAVCARFLTDYQRRLIAQATGLNREHLVQGMAIALATSATNAVGAVGAGTVGGQPGTVDASGDVQLVSAPAGSAVGFDADAETVVVAERGVASGTTLTLTDSASPGWTGAAYVGLHVVFTAGPNVGVRRLIASNTASTLTWDDALPTAASVVDRYEIVQPAPIALPDLSVITELPQTATGAGWLVRLDATGVPYLDLDSPLTVTYTVGCPLPPHQGLLAIHATTTGADPETVRVAIVPWAERHAPLPSLAVCVLGETLHLAGDPEDWTAIASLEVQYVPVPPAFTARTDVFLVPDAAQDAVVSQCAAFLADRVSGMADARITPAQVERLVARGLEAERAYLSMVSRLKRATTSIIREVSF